MPKITEALNSLWIDKDQFSQLYKELVWTPLKVNTSIISEKNMEQIQKLAEDKGISKKKKVIKIIRKKPTTNKVSDSKVIKSDQFQDKTWFLSGMWFGGDQVVYVEEEEKKPDTSVTKKDFEIIKEQVVETRKQKEISRPSYGHRFTHRSGSHHPRVGSHPQKKFAWASPSFSKGKTRPVKDTPTPARKVVKEATTSKNLIKKVEVILWDKVSVKEFSEKIGIGLPEVMKVLLKNKIMVGINSALDFDTANLIWWELGISIKRKELKLEVESFLSGDLQAILDLDKEVDNLEERSPIVTVMGHVDHGKTTLLDYLRKTAVADDEVGGITQSIGASMVEHDGKKITFIDTPGHELFTSLRARGAKLTNVAVIVVAADDSVMPQTIESINHAKAAGVPIIIAITKIDKPGIHIDQIKNDLATHGITPEEWGWDTPIVGVSGITWQGISDLLELIVLQSEMLELKFNPKRSAVWVVLDAYKDPKQGIVTSIIVMTWTLHLRDIVVAYNTSGKIKRMWDRTGKTVGMLKWWEPVQVLWFTDMPEPWRIVEVVKNEKEAVNKVALIQSQDIENKDDSVVEEFLQQLQWGDAVEIPTLKLVLKADWSSSSEALKQAVSWIKLPEKVAIKIIHSDVWPFTDSDISLAQASKALLLWFSLPVQNTTRKKAQSLWVDIKSFDIIYELTEYLEKIVTGMIVIEQEEVSVGKLKILWTFFRKWKEMVIWWEVIEWRVVDKARFIVHRDGAELCKWVIKSLQREQRIVKEVKEWYQCGMKVSVSQKIEEWDILEFLIMQDKKPETEKEKEERLKKNKLLAENILESEE